MGVQGTPVRPERHPLPGWLTRVIPAGNFGQVGGIACRPRPPSRASSHGPKTSDAAHGHPQRDGQPHPGYTPPGAGRSPWDEIRLDMASGLRR
jgi:hypothetical protein